MVGTSNQSVPEMAIDLIKFEKVSCPSVDYFI